MKGHPEILVLRKPSQPKCNLPSSSHWIPTTCLTGAIISDKSSWSSWEAGHRQCFSQCWPSNHSWCSLHWPTENIGILCPNIDPWLPGMMFSLADIFTVRHSQWRKYINLSSARPLSHHHPGTVCTSTLSDSATGNMKVRGESRQHVFWHSDRMIATGISYSSP